MSLSPADINLPENLSLGLPYSIRGFRVQDILRPSGQVVGTIVDLEDGDWAYSFSPARTGSGRTGEVSGPASSAQAAADEILRLARSAR